MSRFPEPVPLPDHVPKMRQLRYEEIVRTARRGALIRSLIILAEIFGFAYLNSSALLADALASMIDVASTVFLIFSIKAAEKPPDTHHPFGHGRLEPIAGLQLALLLVLAGIWMFIQQGHTLIEGLPSRVIEPYTWIIPFTAVVLLEMCHRFVKKTAKRQNSPALLTDALHYRVDGISSLLATLALLLGAFYPSLSVLIDHCGAALIAIFMVIIGVISARNNLYQLLDRTPPAPLFEKVRQAALRVEGVRETEKLKLQVYGPDAHVYIDIEVDPHLSVELAHTIAQKVRREIQHEWPAVRDVVVHVEPYYPQDH